MDAITRLKDNEGLLAFILTLIMIIMIVMIKSQQLSEKEVSKALSKQDQNIQITNITVSSK